MPPVVTDTSAWLKQAFPLPVVITLLVYTMGASSMISSWKAETDARIATLEKVVTAYNSHENRIVVLEQQYIRINDRLIEIRDLLREATKGAEPR